MSLRRQAISRACCQTLESRRMLSFAPAVSYPTGTNPQAIVTADFNNDGKLDLATANAGSNNVSVRLGNGAGGFGAVSHFATGAGPLSVVVGDFNNDDKLDLATANNVGASVSVLLGNGNGTFQPRLDTSLAGTEPLALAVGDLGGNGKMDLGVTASYYYGGPGSGYPEWGIAIVLVGNGSGGFFDWGYYGVDGDPAPLDAQLHDFNADGELDLVTPNGDDSVTMTGGFGNSGTPWGNFPTGPAPQAVAIGDFTGDGKSDLVTAGQRVDVLRGNGDGTFAAPIGSAANGTQHADVAAGDFNGDGKLDAVTADHDTGTVSVLLGNGAGTLTHVRAFAVGVSPVGVAVGDFNGDGRADVAVANAAANGIAVLLNDGGAWPSQTNTPALRIDNAPAVTEGNDGTVNAVFTVTLENAPATNVSVSYATTDGTAAAVADYVPTWGTLTFTPGQTTKTVTVAVKGDHVGEEAEHFYVGLSGASNADILDGVGFGTILDDEPRISVSAPSVTEGNSGTTSATFTLSLSAPSDAVVTVDFSTASGDPRFGAAAISGNDFDPTSGTLTFQPGQTSNTVSVAVRGDRIDETDEYFFLDLSGATNAVIDYAQWVGFPHGPGNGFIVDDDAPPALAISDVSRAEGNAGTTPFQFTVSLSAASELYVGVSYATGSASATNSGPNADYQAKSGTLTFAPGQLTQTVTVLVNGDTRTESDETFVVNLSDSVGATIADAQGVATIFNDESRGKTWVGPLSGGSWSSAGNWSPSGVPAGNSFVTISNASVTLPASATVSELSLVGAARLTLVADGNRVLRTTGLYLDATAELDLTNNNLILDYPVGEASPLGGWNGSAYTGVAGMIASAMNFGEWNGPGIRTSEPAAGPARGLTTLGIGEARDVLFLADGETALWNGVTVDATSVIVKYTYIGDADLNGYVDAVDYGTVDQWIQFPNTANYGNGDFNYDGVIDAVDYGYLDNSIQLQDPPL